MSEEGVKAALTEVDSYGIMTITLNRPDRLNAFNPAMVADCLEAVVQARDDENVRAVVIRGTGRAFSSGDDVVSPGGYPYPLMPGAVGFHEYQQRFIKAWYWLRKPTIAAIHGHCHGFGHDVALSADFRIASSNAIMGDIRAKRAILVGSGGTYLLAHMIGLPEATKLMLTGDLIDAKEIERLGLATVVPAEEFDQKIEELARKLAAGPTKAMGVLKYQMRKSLDQTLGSDLELEAEMFDTPMEDAIEGRKAFAERRDPVFTGR